MKKLIYLVALIFSYSSSAEVKPYMDQMLQQIYILKPFMVSEVDYRDPKNAETISESLKQMVILSEKINHEDKIKKSGFAVSGKALTQQLKESEQVFRLGSKAYSLWMLKSTLNVCMACHTQVPSVSTKFDFQNKDKFLAKSFDEAEFLFVVRNYPKAIELYDRTIASFPTVGVNIEHIEKSLDRKIYYFVRVKRDLSGLEDSLKKNLKNAKLPKYVQDELKDWIKVVGKNKKTQSFPEFAKNQEPQLKAFVEQSLSKELAGDFDLNVDRDLTYLRVSSVLYKFLEENPGTILKPDILYWLAFCERRYSEQAFYSMPEQYLKSCVNEFPGSVVAPKCLSEYKEVVTMAYTGTSGTHIPEDVSKELTKMTALVKKASKEKK